MKPYEQQLWEHTMIAINRILSPAPSLESPTHGCDTARETCGTGVTTSADVAAEISDQGAQS